MNLNPQMLLQMLPALKGNPEQFMQQYGVNMQGQRFTSPQDIAMNLANSGFVDQSTLNFAQNMAKQMGYNI